jgi:hypothetical protein
MDYAGYTYCGLQIPRLLIENVTENAVTSLLSIPPISRDRNLLPASPVGRNNVRYASQQSQPAPVINPRRVIIKTTPQAQSFRYLAGSGISLRRWMRNIKNMIGSLPMFTSAKGMFVV